MVYGSEFFSKDTALNIYNFIIKNKKMKKRVKSCAQRLKLYDEFIRFILSE